MSASMTPADCLQRLADNSPERVLLIEGERQLSAIALRRLALALAGQLRAAGIGVGDQVALYLPRGLDAAVAIYGILQAGACYVPLSQSCPEQRIRFIVDDAACRGIIVHGSPPPWLADSGPMERDLVTLDMATLLQSADAAPSGTALVQDIMPAGSDADRAAILYTSGSTGQPKGVVISRAAIAAFSDWAGQTFSLQGQDRIASLAPFNFDLSLFDLFAVPAVGASCWFVPEALKLAPARLVDWLREHDVSGWYTVPSMLGLVALKGGLARQGLPALKRLLFAGEVFPVGGLRQLAALLPDTELYNLFGPTETNVCLYWPVDRARLNVDRAIPIGRPACGAQLRIDTQQQELLVKGPCLMSGYWRHGELVPMQDVDGWYRSGDRVSRNDAGEFEYHGRLDRMLKCAGYRVEPAEIEQHLQAVAGVEQAVVIGVPDRLSGTRLVAAVSGQGVSSSLLRAQAASQLAAWMRPSFYLLLDVLPRLANGKTDYVGVSRAIEQAMHKPLP